MDRPVQVHDWPSGITVGLVSRCYFRCHWAMPCSLPSLAVLQGWAWNNLTLLCFSLCVFSLRNRGREWGEGSGREMPSKRKGFGKPAQGTLGPGYVLNVRQDGTCLAPHNGPFSVMEVNAQESGNASIHQWKGSEKDHVQAAAHKHLAACFAFCDEGSLTKSMMLAHKADHRSRKTGPLLPYLKDQNQRVAGWAHTSLTKMFIYSYRATTL